MRKPKLRRFQREAIQDALDQGLPLTETAYRLQIPIFMLVREIDAGQDGKGKYSWQIGQNKAYRTDKNLITYEQRKQIAEQRRNGATVAVCSRVTGINRQYLIWELQAGRDPETGKYDPELAQKKFDDYQDGLTDDHWCHHYTRKT